MLNVHLSAPNGCVVSSSFVQLVADTVSCPTSKISVNLILSPSQFSPHCYVFLGLALSSISNGSLSPFSCFLILFVCVFGAHQEPQEFILVSLADFLFPCSSGMLTMHCMIRFSILNLLSLLKYILPEPQATKCFSSFLRYFLKSGLPLPYCLF